MNHTIQGQYHEIVEHKKNKTKQNLFSKSKLREMNVSTCNTTINKL